MDELKEEILKEIPSGGAFRSTLLIPYGMMKDKKCSLSDSRVYGLYQFFSSSKVPTKELRFANRFKAIITHEAKRWIAKHLDIPLKELEKIKRRLVKVGWIKVELKEDGIELITLCGVNTKTDKGIIEAEFLGNLEVEKIEQ